MSYWNKIFNGQHLAGTFIVFLGILISLSMLHEVSGSTKKLAITSGGGCYGQASYGPPPPHVIGSGSFSTPNCYSYSYSQGYYYNYGQGYYYTYSQGSYGSISSFTGTSSSSGGSGTAIAINAGESVTLAWSTSGFTSCTLTDNHGNTIMPPPGGATSTNNSKVATPTENTVYTLTCNPNSVSGQVSVTIRDVPIFQEIAP